MQFVDWLIRLLMLGQTQTHTMLGTRQLSETDVVRVFVCLVSDLFNIFVMGIDFKFKLLVLFRKANKVRSNITAFLRPICVVSCW